VQPETRYAKSGDVSIAYQVVGEGPFDVVLIPDISHVELAWEQDNHHGEIPRRLASFARLIVFDRRGMGMSDRVAGETVETRMDDIRAVMDAAGSTRAALFSLNDGTAVSLVFAATYPERTSALVLLTAYVRVLWAPDFPWGMQAEEVEARYAPFMRLFYGSREEALEVARFVRGTGPSEEELLRDLEYIRRAAGSPRAMQTFLAMHYELDVRQVLPGIQAPTLLINGTESTLYPIEAARWAAEQIPGARLLELPGQPLIPSGAGLQRALDEAEVFLKEAWESGAWDEPEPDRVLATVMFTDIVDSSQRATDLGDRAWRQLLQKHHELVRRQLVRFRGKEVDTAGDGFLASFDGPARAIRCAQAIVDGVHALGLEVRAGLHTGECELLDGKVAGIAVHTGARVAAEAAPGEVLVSSTVKDLVAGSGLAFQDRGTHELKGVPGEWRLFAVEPTALRVTPWSTRRLATRARATSRSRTR
jgi:class 3 adenylate cyclase/pimeloyl-ACP methyl ester carboxylesterase